MLFWSHFGITYPSTIHHLYFNHPSMDIYISMDMYLWYFDAISPRKTSWKKSGENLEKLEKINRKHISIIPQPISNHFSTFEISYFFSNFLPRLIPIQATGGYDTHPSQGRLRGDASSRLTNCRQSKSAASAVRPLQYIHT